MSLCEAFNVRVPEHLWRNTGPEDDPSLRLLATCIVNGIAFHMEAYRVAKQGTQDLDNNTTGFFDTEWNSLCGLQDYGAYQTLEIRGKPYVLVITPHCD